MGKTNVIRQMRKITALVLASLMIAGESGSVLAVESGDIGIAAETAVGVVEESQGSDLGETVVENPESDSGEEQISAYGETAVTENSESAGNDLPVEVRIDGDGSAEPNEATIQTDAVEPFETSVSETSCEDDHDFGDAIVPLWSMTEEREGKKDNGEGLSSLSAGTYEIKNNGLNGIYVDINSYPYTSTQGMMASLKKACTWFVGARIAELSGRNPGIHAGIPWWNGGKGNYGYSAGSIAPNQKAVACYTNHVSIVEAFDGNIYTISEGGNSLGRESEKYCQITTRTLAQIKSLGGASGNFLGFVYLGIPFPSSDNEKPIIKRVYTDNITDTGYDVFCEVSDNEGIESVAFPTWTAANGQDDLIHPWVKGTRVFGHIKAGTYKYHVDISQYGNRRGRYITHIYAYDKSNNVSDSKGIEVEIKANVPSPTILDQLDDKSVKIQTTSTSTWISIDGGEFVQYYPLNDYPLNTVGVHTVRAYSQDSTGTRSKEVSKSFSISKSEKPGISIDEAPDSSYVSFTKNNSGTVIHYSINGGGFQKYTSRIKRTENTTIRYYTTRTGCVQSDTYEYKLTLTAPKTPKATLGNKEKKIGIGDVIMINLDKQNKASEYICTVKKDGAVYKTVTSQDNNVSINTEESGEYEITAKAKNKFGESKSSNAVSITVMPNVIVRFEDWDGTLLKEQEELKWGGSTAAPGTPSREGYDFEGWDKSFSNLTEDTIVKPKYKIKVFTVTFKFLNEESNVTSVVSRRVEWGQGAEEPDTTPFIPGPGYVFAGWDVDNKSECEDFRCVKGNMTLYATYAWENSNYTAALSSFKVVCKKIEEDEDGGNYYDVSATLSCSPTARTKARAVLVLSTAAGRTVAVKTEDITLFKGQKSKELHFEVLKENGEEDSGNEAGNDSDASKAALYLVGYDKGTGGTYAKCVKTDITREVYYDSWSSWSTTKPEADEIASKKQYRYKTRKTATSTTSKTMTDYTLVSTDTKVGNWSGWQDSSVSTVNNDSKKREVETRQVVTDTKYRYGHYCGRTNLGWETFPWNTSAFISNAAYHELGTFSESDSRMQYVGVASDTGAQMWNYYPDGNRYRCSNTCYHWYRIGDPIYSYKTQYRYRDTTYVYHFEQISNWTSWSDKKPSSYYQIQERTMYRGRNEVASAPLQEVNNTETIHVEGSLLGSDDVSGKTATVFVYKQTNTDPIESQIEYMNEIKIGTNNSYSFDAIPRENPSEKTGDFVVAFALEGAKRLINVKVIQAPKPNFTVNFIANGAIISTQTVKANGSAQVPEAPEVQGMKFVMWSQSVTNVTEDINTEAVYVEASYAVVYVDKLNGTVELVRAAFNDPIKKDYPVAPDGYISKGWDAEVVTGDMIVNAVYEKSVYTVRFMDASGENVVDTKTCGYGESVLPPSYEYMTAGEGQRITGWSMEKDWRHVTEDMYVYPIVEYEKTAAAPNTSLTSMDLCHYRYVDYDVDLGYPTIDLKSDDDNAKIYYTTDGSDPEIHEDELDTTGVIPATGSLSGNALLYSEPIEITSDMIIKAICLVDGKNTSDIAEFPVRLEEIEAFAGGFLWGDEEQWSDDPTEYDPENMTYEEARKLNRGSLMDTDSLVLYGKKYVFEPATKDSVVTVAKGNKFLLDGNKNSFAISPADKKIISVSKGGTVTAKKSTAGELVEINYIGKNGAQVLKVQIVEPAISSNVLSVKKNTATGVVGDDIDIYLDVPLNALYDRFEVKNKGVVENLDISFYSDERFHIKGTAVKKGTVSIPIHINGKKFTFKIKINKLKPAAAKK